MQVRRWLPSVGLGALLAVITACSPSIAQQSPPTPPPPAAPPSKIVIATSTPFDTLDPHVVFDTRRAAPRLNFYDALYRWVEGPVRVAPWLAQSYTLSEDGKIFRFTLRKNARFHDGAEVKAGDVVYSIERVLALKRGVAPLMASFVNPGSTKAIDASTVEFSLTKPAPNFLGFLPEVPIVNSELLKSKEVNNDWGRVWLARNEAGSGAYKLKSMNTSGGFEAERVPEHWSDSWQKKPVDIAEFRPMLDTEAAVESLLKGDIQILDAPLLPAQRRRIKEAKDVAVVEDESPRLMVGLIDSGRDPTKLAEVRRILVNAFDFDSYIKTSLSPGATRSLIPLPSTYASPSLGAAGATQRFDLDAARAQLEKLKTPIREIIIGAVAGDATSERAAVVMLDGLVKLGIPARIVAEPWPAVANRMRDEKQMYDVLFLWQGPRYLDPNNWVGEMYDCDMFGIGNSSWYCNRDADKLIKEGRAATEAKQRTAAFESAAIKVAEDAAGIFIATARAPLGYTKKLKNVGYTPTGETTELRMLNFE